MSIQTQWIDVQTADGAFGAYLAAPSHKTGPGIVLIQEIFGVNDHIAKWPTNTRPMATSCSRRTSSGAASLA